MYVHFWYLAEFFLEWEMLQTKVVHKIKTPILCSVSFFCPKIVPFVRMWENTVAPNRQQYCMAHAWKLAATHTKYLIYIGFTRQQWLRDALRYYFTLRCLCCCVSFRLPTGNRYHDVKSGEREGHKGWFNYSASLILRKAINYWLCLRLHRVAGRTNFSAGWCQNLSSIHFGIYCDRKDDVLHCCCRTWSTRHSTLSSHSTPCISPGFSADQ